MKMLKESPVKKPYLRIVFDTNIYIAAFLKSGLCRQIFEMAQEKEFFTLLVSKDILNELDQKLKRKFSVSREVSEKFRRIILGTAGIIKTKKIKITNLKDKSDILILECAISGKANLIISMDRHLLRLKSYKNIGIAHPKSLRYIIPK